MTSTHSCATCAYLLSSSQGSVCNAFRTPSAVITDDRNCSAWREDDRRRMPQEEPHSLRIMVDIDPEVRAEIEAFMAENLKAAVQARQLGLRILFGQLVLFLATIGLMAVYYLRR